MFVHYLYIQHDQLVASHHSSWRPLTITVSSLSTTMAPKDRTAEFHSTLSSIRSRTALPPKSQSQSQSKKYDEAKERLLPDGPSGTLTPGRVGGGVGGSDKGKGKDAGVQKSEFGRMASGIAKDINATTLKLQKLAQRACGLSSYIPPASTLPFALELH